MAIGTSVKTKDKVLIPKSEYTRLRKIDKRFKEFWLYMEHLFDIREAREEVRRKKVIPQESLFKQLGF